MKPLLHFSYFKDNDPKDMKNDPFNCIEEMLKKCIRKRKEDKSILQNLDDEEFITISLNDDPPEKKCCTII